MTHKRNGLYRISHARYQIHRLGVRVADRLRMISLDERPLLELNETLKASLAMPATTQ
jgi:hypothetical protein